MYSKEVMEHFKNPKYNKELKKFNGEGKVGNPVCGDVMVIRIYVENDIIKDISFSTFGCAAAIASSDMLCELAKGKTIEEAEKITRDNVADALEGLPKIKMHCSNLAADGLKKAIEDYKKKK